MDYNCSFQTLNTDMDELNNLNRIVDYIRPNCRLTPAKIVVRGIG